MKDIKVELDDEFDRNFERKAFFTTSWKPAKRNAIGSLMNRTGALRSSLRSTVGRDSITWKSSLPYANIQNNGGTIRVTQRMKGFFWSQFYLAGGKGNGKNLSDDAKLWRALALKPVGSTIRIPKRQFIGYHPEVDKGVRDATNSWFNDALTKDIDGQLRDMVK